MLPQQKKNGLHTGLVLSGMVCVLAFLVDFPSYSTPPELLANFADALVQNKQYEMCRIVQSHEKEMGKTFFGLVHEAASLLKQVPDDKEKQQIKAVLYVASALADTFGQVHPQENVLCRYLEGSQDLLTDRMKTHSASDVELARYLKDCANEVEHSWAMAGIASDFDSLIAAASETPQEQAARRAREEEDRRRAERVRQSERERASAFRVRLEAVGRQGGVNALAELLDDSSLGISERRLVIEHLGRPGAGEAVGVLSRYVDVDGLQKAAVEALGRIGDTRSVGVLVRKLNDSTTSEAVEAALLAIGGEPVVQALIDVLDNNKATERAGGLLRRMWGDEARSRMIGLLHDPSLRVEQQRAVIGELARLGSAASVEEILLFADRKEFQDEVISALGLIGGEAAITTLIPKLDDASVANLAMHSLTRIGRPAIPALVDRLSRPGQAAGMMKAAQVLTRLKYAPTYSRARAYLHLARQQPWALTFQGIAAVSVAREALRSDDAGIRAIGWKVLLMLTILATVAGITGFLLLLLILRRRWIFPRVKAVVPAGGYTQLHGVISAKASMQYSQPGTVLETCWAKSRVGRRQRIKVEIFVREKGAGKKSRCDVLVAVGASVLPGIYLAKGRTGSVRVEVTA